MKLCMHSSVEIDWIGEVVAGIGLPRECVAESRHSTTAGGLLPTGNKTRRLLLLMHLKRIRDRVGVRSVQLLEDVPHLNLLHFVLR